MKMFVKCETDGQTDSLKCIPRYIPIIVLVIPGPEVIKRYKNMRLRLNHVDWLILSVHYKYYACFLSTVDILIYYSLV